MLRIFLVVREAGVMKYGEQLYDSIVGSFAFSLNKTVF